MTIKPLKIKIGKIDNKLLRKKVFSSPSYRRESFAVAKKALEEIRLYALREFEEHGVTKELREGKEAGNISRTLRGYGNLFTFIGFPNGVDPIGIVRRIIEKTINLQQTKDPNRFIITVPELSDFQNAKMPWEAGRSWVMAIERGISGFSFYMYKHFGDGRSKKGLQTKNKIREGMYRPVSYMSGILRKVNNRIRRL